MTIDETTENGITILRLRGELDLRGVPALRERLTAAGDAERPRVIVNLEGVSYVDSAGLGVLVGALKSCAGRGGRLVLVGPAANVRHVLEITRLVQHFAIHATEEQACRAFA